MLHMSSGSRCSNFGLVQLWVECHRKPVLKTKCTIESMSEFCKINITIEKSAPENLGVAKISAKNTVQFSRYRISRLLADIEKFIIAHYRS